MKIVILVFLTCRVIFLKMDDIFEENWAQNIIFWDYPQSNLCESRANDKMMVEKEPNCDVENTLPAPLHLNKSGIIIVKTNGNALKQDEKMMAWVFNIISNFKV